MQVLAIIANVASAMKRMVIVSSARFQKAAFKDDHIGHIDSSE